MRLITLPVLALACTPKPADPGSDPTPPVVDTDAPTADSDAPTLPPVDTGSRAEDACDGADDDDDGRVDEGWPDADGDGVADCVDGCTTRVPPGGPAPFHRCPADPFTPSADPWRAEALWAWRGTRGTPERRHVAMTPVVSQLTDDDGDGDIDRHDSPDVAFVAGTTVGDRFGTLVILDGATGTTILERDDVVAGWAQEIAVADVDGDGRPEVLVTASDSRLLAVHADGTLAWRSTARMPWPVRTHVTSLGDDGVVDIFVGDLRLDGRTGAVVATTTSSQTWWAAPLGADLTGDGRLDWVVGREVFDAGGALRFAIPDAAHTWHQHLPVQADDDPALELVFYDRSGVQAVDLDGTPLWTLPLLDATGAGPGAVADLDGDGVFELAVPENGHVRVVGLDGTPGFRVAVSDTSAAAGLVAADLDGDGAAEILMGDEDALRVLDGASGDVRMVVGGRTSMTAMETPALADLDGDGSVDILTCSNPRVPADEPLAGLVAFRHPDGAWAPGPRGLATVVDDGASVREDGRVPVVPDTGVRSAGTFRAPATWAVAEAPHHHVQWVSTCAESDPATLVLQVANRGGVDAAAATLVVEHLADDGSVTPLLTRPVPPLAAGTALPSVAVSFVVADHPTGEVVARLEGAATACGPPAHRAVWAP